MKCEAVTAAVTDGDEDDTRTIESRQLTAEISRSRDAQPKLCFISCCLVYCSSQFADCEFSVCLFTLVMSEDEDVSDVGGNNAD